MSTSGRGWRTDRKPALLKERRVGVIETPYSAWEAESAVVGGGLWEEQVGDLCACGQQAP